MSLSSEASAAFATLKKLYKTYTATELAAYLNTFPKYASVTRKDMRNWASIPPNSENSQRKIIEVVLLIEEAIKQDSTGFNAALITLRKIVEDRISAAVKLKELTEGTIPDTRFKVLTESRICNQLAKSLSGEPEFVTIRKRTIKEWLELTPEQSKKLPLKIKKQVTDVVKYLADYKNPDASLNPPELAKSAYNIDDPANLIMPVREGEIQCKFAEALALQRIRKGPDSWKKS